MADNYNMIDEDRLEEAFWDFDHERKVTAAERDAFKHKARGLLRFHLRPLYDLLERTSVYLTAYTTGFDPPGDMERAQYLKREVTDALSEYLRTYQSRNHGKDHT